MAIDPATASMTLSATRAPTTGVRPRHEPASHLDPQQRTWRFVHRQLDSGANGSAVALFGADGLSFGDVIDAINPLQHIPLVSTLYRRITGDTIAPAARIAGDALYGGPLGLVMGIANVAVEAASGRDLTEQALALLEGGGPAAPAGSLVNETA